MTAVMSFCCLCLFLVLGKLLRAAVPALQKLYLPASVIGGLLGLLAINTIGRHFSPSWFASWGALPGFLINIVFAALFLGLSTGGAEKNVWRLAAPQVVFGQILSWGQYVVGLGIVIVLLGPLYGVPDVFGNLLEIGFEGGHGTVGGMAETFRQLGWPEGADLGYTVATAGMILGIVIGMIMVNIGARRGYVGNIRTFRDQTKLERIGVYPEAQQPSAGRQTVFPDSIDSLALHIALIGIAVLIGYIFKMGLSTLDTVAPKAIQDLHILRSFPLFPLCMIGGLLLQIFLNRTKTDIVADAGQMQRLSGTALDFLVVSAIATIRIEFVVAYWQPLLGLIVVGTIWNTFLVMVVGKRIFRDAWFERSIAEYGQSMGVTATGLLLLRTVDPEMKTNAASAFGYKQLVHEPIMGGGIWTSLAVPLVMTQGAPLIFGISLVILVFWFAFWAIFLRTKPAA